jgi:hypothetical protein
MKFHRHKNFGIGVELQLNGFMIVHVYFRDVDHTIGRSIFLILVPVLEL